jgi:hypothetical protein
MSNAYSLKMRGANGMEKTKKGFKIALMVGLIALMASPAFAREISLKGSGTALWVFIIIGSIIVLLQLIPAAILFFGFIGTATATLFKKVKRGNDEIVLQTGEPLTAKK